ncbi:MAG: APC family permease [Acidobacteria bacterium]|nr:APC family permease [Acidobacteriota bacterium]
MALARKLRTVDFFSLSWGTMIGAGWLVLMDDWLARGGAAGAILGFALCGVALLPIAWVYGQLVAAMPAAGAELAYAEAVMPPRASFFAGWLMIPAYLVVCPWEAVAVGKILARLFPALATLTLYRVAGTPVHLPQLAIGFALIAAIACLNYRGIAVTARFQNWASFIVLAFGLVFVLLAAVRGSPRNLQPLFQGSPWISVLLVLQIAPYFLTGFEAVGKCSEEARADFDSRRFFLPIVLALTVGVAFYVAMIAAASYVYPWRTIPSGTLLTAVAFERAFGAPWLANAILAAALISLVKIFNGNFVAATRLLFALGRGGYVPRALGRLNPRHQTPVAAIVALAIVTGLAVLAGESSLVPITEIGSAAGAAGWLFACVSHLLLGRQNKARRNAAIALAGAAVAAALLAIKLLPMVPGHFTRTEYALCVAWILVGAGLYRPRAAQGIAS